MIYVEHDWKTVLTAFPSSRYDVEQGVDCHACDHNSAAIFHMMRVAEIGLTRLASERKVKLKKDRPLSHAQWGEIIGAVEKSAAEILRTARAGHEKDLALAFYNSANSHARALKDRYRNAVMHSRREFSTHEAADAISHTKSFMTGLAERLNEKSNRQIRWRF